MKTALKRMSSPLASRLLKGRSLTVLCYHRVVDAVEPGLFPDVASANPKTFEGQLDVMAAGHQFIGEDDVIAWLRQGKSLPERPLLLTFDDGYRDNFDTVFPILTRKGIQATFFVTTGHMDTGELLWWDQATATFTDTQLVAANVPLLGPVSIPDGDERIDLARSWVMAAKDVPDPKRREALSQLAGSLEVTTPTPRPRVAMTWDQARKMVGSGMSFGGHTDSHPILSRMGPETMTTEIATGLDRMREELDREVRTFAYPNGQREDFDTVTRRVVAELGVVVAFSLLSGPASLNEVAGDPLAVRRIYVGGGDDPEKLALKLLGWGRVADLKSRIAP